MTTTHEPNEEGFAGDPTAPEPRPDEPDPHAAAEEVAVPDDDLTSAVVDAVDEADDKR